MLTSENRPALQSGRTAKTETPPDVMLSLLREKGVTLPKGAFVGPEPVLVRYFIPKQQTEDRHPVRWLQAVLLPGIQYHVWSDIALKLAQHKPNNPVPVFKGTSLELIAATAAHAVLAEDGRFGGKRVGMSFGFHHVDQHEDRAADFYRYVHAPVDGDEGGLLFLWYAVPAIRHEPGTIFADKRT